MPTEEPLWRRYLRFFGANPRADVNDEIQFHLQELQRRFQSEGMTAPAAERAAREQFGDVERLRRALERTSTRHRRWLHWVEWWRSLTDDFRLAVRQLSKQPAFALSIIVMLGLGVGATTAMYSVVDAAMLKPLPFDDPGRLVYVAGIMAASGSTHGSGKGWLDVMGVEDMHDVFSSVAAYVGGPAGLNLNDPGHPERLNVSLVTWRFFATLGVRAARGRTFTAAEGAPNGPRVAVLSDACWRREFGGAPVVGKNVTLNQETYAIVGVMPPSFAFPHRSDIWIPLSMPLSSASFEAIQGMALGVNTIARLRDGVPLAAASARIRAAWRQRLDRARADRMPTSPVSPLQSMLVASYSRGMIVLLGATGLLLLLACADVANLQLSRAAFRRREIAVRAALGGTRARIARQLFAESILLAGTGAAFGVCLAPATFGLLRQLLPPDLADVAPPQLDARVLAFAVVLIATTSVVFGLWPALSSARADPHEAMKAGSTGATSSVASGVTRRALVVAEVALAVVLVAGAGLMLRSLMQLDSTDTGFQTSHVGTMYLTVVTPQRADAHSNPPWQERIVLDEIRRRLAATPGVTHVGVVQELPLTWGGLLGQVAAHGAVESSIVGVHYIHADSGYLRTMGIGLVRGRWFTARDDSVKPGVIVLSRSVADSLWHGVNPIGQTVDAGMFGLGQRIVIGVVQDVRDFSLRESTTQAYLPLDEDLPPTMAMVAKGRLPDDALLAGMRRAVRLAAPTLPPYDVRMFDVVVASSISVRRAQTTLIAMFGALALLMATFGVYAVVSYGTARRAREFGIRAALGASGSALARQVAHESILMAGAGVVVGVVGAWAATRVLASLLYGVAPTDPVTFILTAGLLVVAALLATLGPALRTSRTNVMDVLRAE